MMGELKLIELRDKAKKTLGDKFNVASTHNAVLPRAPCRSSSSKRSSTSI